ncbi:uncharacterized protein LOC111284464 [Durio zibethinus]|uniref:Uncharacterized protein LOC111284464 n=1 Tax=Durio zibethinus TaxID=66656 RepID=A0A6P5XKX7_DURZI|nr:uncharacterized protein LOC111284464 [Durio zibethinus]
MAPNREKNIVSPHSQSNGTISKSRLSMESLQRTISDISFELSKEAVDAILPPISEVEDANCECCGMSEECTPEYISQVRDKFSGKLVCGLCAAAINEEVEKNGGKREEALNEHMSACVRFNRLGRTHPLLYQAEAMREILKKSSRIRAKSMSPRDKSGPKKGGISRSSSCMADIAKENSDQTMYLRFLFILLLFKLEIKPIKSRATIFLCLCCAKLLVVPICFYRLPMNKKLDLRGPKEGSNKQSFMYLPMSWACKNGLAQGVSTYSNKDKNFVGMKDTPGANTYKYGINGTSWDMHKSLAP